MVEQAPNPLPQGFSPAHGENIRALERTATKLTPNLPGDSPLRDGYAEACIQRPGAR